MYWIKRGIILFCIISSIFLLTACKKDEKEMKELISNMTEEDVMDSYTVDGIEYTVYLSKTTPYVYNFKIENDIYYIKVSSDRGIADLYQVYELKKYFYKVNTSDNKIYEYYNYKYDDENGYEEIAVLENSDNKLNVAKYIQNYLGDSGELVTFSKSGILDIIKEINSMVKPRKMNVMGAFNDSFIRYSIGNRNEYIEKATMFKSHLKEIYNEDIYEKYIESFKTSSKYRNDLYLSVSVKNGKIMPKISLEYQMLDFYSII